MKNAIMSSDFLHKDDRSVVNPEITGCQIIFLRFHYASHPTVTNIESNPVL